MPHGVLCFIITYTAPSYSALFDALSALKFIELDELLTVQVIPFVTTRWPCHYDLPQRVSVPGREPQMLRNSALVVLANELD